MKNKPECRIPSDKTIREVCSHLVESSEAAQIIGVTQPSVLRYVEGGKIFGVKVGGALLLRRADAEKFVKGTRGRPRINF